MKNELEKNLMTKAEIFEDMVLLGIACGLETPQEWYLNYELRLTNFYKYSDIPLVSKIMQKEILPSLYLVYNDEPHQNEEQLIGWIYK